MRKSHRENAIKRIITEYINNNIKKYILLTIIFFIGLIFGIIIINNTDQDSQTQLKTYINNFTDTINSNQQVDTYDLIIESVKINSFIVLILCFLGSTIIGMPLIYLVILIKGYSLGYSIASIVATLGVGKGIIFTLVTILIPYIIYIPVILSTAVSGINLYSLVISNRRLENIKVELFKHIVFCILMIMIITIISIISMYLSVWLVPYMLKN